MISSVQCPLRLCGLRGFDELGYGATEVVGLQPAPTLGTYQPPIDVASAFLNRRPPWQIGVSYARITAVRTNSVT
jgi:hypothetical protein